MALKMTDARMKAAEAALQRKRDAQKAASLQAYKDALVVPEDPVDETPAGEKPPLHVLNVRNRKIDRERKDANLEAAKAAASAVHETLASSGQGAARKKRKPRPVAGKNTAGTKVATPPTNRARAGAVPAAPDKGAGGAET